MTRPPYYHPSSIHIVQRTPKTDVAPNGVRAANRINLGRPALIVLGGVSTHTKRNANYYASLIQDILHGADVTDIDMYSVYYTHGDRNPRLDHTEIFRRAGYRISASTPPYADRFEDMMAAQNANEFIPDGVIRAYRIFIRPRLITADGKRRDMETILNYMRRIYFWVHSYGGTIMRFLGDYMRDDMQKIGFSRTDIDAICKNILVIQHAPVAPLYHHPFTTLNFISCSDTVIENVNYISNYLTTNAADVDGVMYFNNTLGNFITTGQFDPNFIKEHDASPLRQPSFEYKSLTPNGRIVMDAERNAIIAAARNAIAGGPIPTVEKLVAGPTVDFDQIRKNGELFYKFMLTDIRPQKQSLRPDYQK